MGKQKLCWTAECVATLMPYCAVLSSSCGPVQTCHSSSDLCLITRQCLRPRTARILLNNQNNQWHHPSSSASKATTITNRREGRGEKMPLSPWALFGLLNNNFLRGNDKHMKQLHKRKFNSVQTLCFQVYDASSVLTFLIWSQPGKAAFEVEVLSQPQWQWWATVISLLLCIYSSVLSFLWSLILYFSSSHGINSCSLNTKMRA